MKPSHRKLSLALIFFLVCGVTAFGASTGGNVLMDYLMRTAMVLPNELTWSLTQEFRYNDNMDETSRGSRSSSWINETTIGVKLTRTVSQMTYGLNASGSYEHYFHKRKNDDSSDFSYSFSPVLLGNIGGDSGIFGGKLMVAFSSSHDREEVDDSKNKTTSVFRNSLKVAWDKPITGKVSAILTGTLESERYMDNLFDGLNNEKYGISLSPSYRYSDRTRFGLTSGITRTDYRKQTEHDDYDDVKFGLFCEHIFNERTAGWLETGATKTYYKSHSISSESNHEGTWEWYVRGRLMYQLLKDVALGLSLGRDVEDSLSSSVKRGNRMVYEAAGTVTWNLTGKVTMINKLSYTLKDEKNCDDDNDRIEYDLHLQYQSSHGAVYYAGWNLIDDCYRYRSSKNYVENEWRFGVRISY